MKSVRLFLVLTLVALALTACSTNPAQEAQTSPSLSPSASATDAMPSAEGSPAATSNLNAQTDTFIAVGEKAVMTVGSTKLSGAAYYPAGDEKTMLLPFTEVCKALGWKVEEPSAAGKGEIKLTQDGMDEVVVTLTVPADDNAGMLEGVTATKGGKAVTVTGESFAWIDGQLYTTEKFISDAVQQIEVNYDGASSIQVNAKA
ncbi:MAG TPA: hypothetical protein IAC36_08555 [Candidatus Aphodomonas merdavium]|nr:hypothetical protein [Candidatus Aphodomonas merdavium]